MSVPIPRRPLTPADFSPRAGSYRLPDRRHRPRVVPASTAPAPMVVTAGMHVSYPMRDRVATLYVECVTATGGLVVMSSDGYSEPWDRVPSTTREATADEIRTFERIRDARRTPVAYE